MDEARYWIIGLVALSLLAVGVATVLVPAMPVEELGNNDWATASASTSAWGDAPSNFAAGEVADEHQGGGNSVGWGKLTVSDVCLQEGIDSELAVSRLGEYELPMNLTQRIRELADLSGYKPSEVVDILLGKVPGEHEDGDCDCGECDSEAQHEDDDSDDPTTRESDL